MNGIGISSTIFDTAGALYLDGKDLSASEMLANTSRSRRVTRTATLDGGVSVYDAGYAPGDRNMTVKVPDPSRAISDYLLYIAETYNEILITTEDGAYTGVPERAYIDSYGAAIMSVLITGEA
jgi:hypothetical protein